mmetsp:Transcript_16707/g.35456  ORF Transcript_16707/g.35456 Transcript_16707/m.35456 type:complete len:820 (+) Transcript_16707:157-2616(+)
MRHAAALCCCLASLARIALGQISDGNKELLQRELGTEVVEELVYCNNEASVCPIEEYVVKLVKPLKDVRKNLDLCPVGCAINDLLIGDLWATVTSEFEQIRDACSAVGDFPQPCQTFKTLMDARFASDRYDIGIMARILIPGPMQVRLPVCKELMSSIVATYKTLTACSSMEHDQCVDHFCKLNSIFRWRMRPRNLQDNLTATNFYAGHFVLPGCEDVERYAFVNETCPERRDIQGMCGCLCDADAIPTVEGAPLEECPFNLDAYLVFGRQGVRGSGVPVRCESELCRVFEQKRMQQQCLDLELPNARECAALSLPYRPDEANHSGSEACPWKRHSGESKVLQCIDGHRCSIQDEGWACCENHRGRGQCPLEHPVMCDTLCSGDTEFCCGEVGMCTPRSCSPILQAEPEFFLDTSTTTTTLPPAAMGTGADDEGILSNISLRLPQGSWVWLLFLVPCCLGGTIFGLWMHLRRFDTGPVIVVKEKIEENIDKLGSFHIVRKRPDDDKTRKKPPVKRIMVGELPHTRPLGLELQETLVIRVHAPGAKWGFEVGDAIVNVAGHKVNTFEELWERIQVERQTGEPVAFMVHRYGDAAIMEQAKDYEPGSMPVRQKQDPKAKAKGRRDSRRSSVAASLAASPTRASQIASLPGKASSPKGDVLRGAASGDRHTTMGLSGLTGLTGLHGADALSEGGSSLEPGAAPDFETWATAVHRDERWVAALQEDKDFGFEQDLDLGSTGRHSLPPSLPQAPLPMGNLLNRSRLLECFEVLQQPATDQGGDAPATLADVATSIKRSGPKEVRYMRDAWGRSVVKVEHRNAKG